MNSLVAIACCVAMLCALGCAGAEAPTPLALRPLAKGGFTGIAEPKLEIVKDAGQWTKLWGKHAGKSTTPCPKVDFTKEMVVVASLGSQRTGGYSIQVVGAELTRDKLRIYIKRTAPRQGGRTIQVFTAPFDFVAVARSEFPAEFVDAPKTADK